MQFCEKESVWMINEQKEKDMRRNFKARTNQMMPEDKTKGIKAHFSTWDEDECEYSPRCRRFDSETFAHVDTNIQKFSQYDRRKAEEQKPLVSKRWCVFNLTIHTLIKKRKSLHTWKEWGSGANCSLEGMIQPLKWTRSTKRSKLRLADGGRRRPVVNLHPAEQKPGQQMGESALKSQPDRACASETRECTLERRRMYADENIFGYSVLAMWRRNERRGKGDMTTHTHTHTLPLQTSENRAQFNNQVKVVY